MANRPKQTATGLTWGLVKTCIVSTYDSKALHRDSWLALQTWRYYLLANRPEQKDTDFTWSDLAAKNNNELLANLGNFINRGLSFVYSK